MQCIDFDRQFQAYMTQWVQDNAAAYGNNIDRMEAQMPEVYLQWLNAPADWLDEQTPGTYFAQFDDVPMLISWMRAYFEKSVPIPDQLMERITDLGADAEAALVALLEDDTAPDDARLTAISLLSEMQSRQPMALYIRWIAARESDDEHAEMAAEALTAMGRSVVKPVLDAVERATTADARAIPHLLAAMDDPDLNYLDYIELRNALEAAGGDAPPERAYDGDPYYESLRRME